MFKKKPRTRPHNLQDAAKPLDDFDRLARKRLGLPPPEKLVNPSRRRWLPPLLLLLLAACLLSYGVFRQRKHSAALPPPRALTVAFLDVGQGDSTLIQTPSGKNILLDTGPPSAVDSLFAELGRRGVTRLDMLIISHPDRDHDGNCLAVLRRLPTATVVDSGFVKASSTQIAMLAEIKRQGIPLVNVTQQRLAGTRQDLGDGVMLTYLAPAAYSPDANNSSIILKVALGRVSVLCIGDAEGPERASLLVSGQDAQATVLKVAHHGSQNGTDDAFLARVHPEVAVISCGLDNRFRHPNQATLDALRRAGASVWRTDLQGTINLQTDGRTYQVGLSPK